MAAKGRGALRNASPTPSAPPTLRQAADKRP
jgi:hypothetical protein